MSFITWRENLGRPECPYMKRWVINFGLFAIRLHKWTASDDDRYLHDHPWNFLIFVLKGRYTDIYKITENTTSGNILCAGRVYFRKAEYRQFFSSEQSPVWTLVISGHKKRKWGFWVNGKFKKANKYFFEHAKLPCDL